MDLRLRCVHCVGGAAQLTCGLAGRKSICAERGSQQIVTYGRPLTSVSPDGRLAGRIVQRSPPLNELYSTRNAPVSVRLPVE